VPVERETRARRTNDHLGAVQLDGRRHRCQPGARELTEDVAGVARATQNRVDVDASRHDQRHR